MGGGGLHILWFMNNKTKLIATAQRSQRLLQQAHLNPLSLSLSLIKSSVFYMQDAAKEQVRETSWGKYKSFSSFTKLKKEKKKYIY